MNIAFDKTNKRAMFVGRTAKRQNKAVLEKPNNLNVGASSAAAEPKFQNKPNWDNSDFNNYTATPAPSISRILRTSS